MIEQKAQVEAKLEAKGVEAERAIEMSEREVRVYCSQRSLAAIHERLDEQKTLVEEAKQRKAAEKIATAESHRPEAQESLPGHLQQATERSDYHRRSDATNTDLTYLEGYDMPPPTGESYHNRRRHSTELQERGRTERVESDVDHDWRSNESARIDNEISDYHSRGAHQSGSIDRLHASRRHPSNTSRETCQNEYRDQRDRCTTYKEYRFRDYILHPDDLLSEHSASGRSPEDWRDFLTHTSSRPGSPVEKDRESPLSVARVDLGELEPSNIFGNSRNLDQGLSAEDHNRLF
ncbi:uncharacterized protein LOC111254524 [Varroa destructor]|uniref:Uncharacterized protein n=1 Tax=Varroa destructor TaxID=109461 RepID=A0A7M7KS84_VARDE|nr:uncharacterized protein LOC111254524 [Varroa destructor]